MSETFLNQCVGFGRVHTTIKDGVRMSAARAYLRPARERPNLHVATQALVYRVCQYSHQSHSRPPECE